MNNNITDCAVKTAETTKVEMGSFSFDFAFSDVTSVRHGKQLRVAEPCVKIVRNKLGTNSTKEKGIIRLNIAAAQMLGITEEKKYVRCGIDTKNKAIFIVASEVKGRTLSFSGGKASTGAHFCITEMIIENNLRDQTCLATTLGDGIVIHYE